MANIVENFKAGNVYNISGDEYHDIKKISDIISKFLEKDDSMVKYENVEEHNTLNKKGDNTKAKRDLEYKSTVDIKEGIRRTIEWQKKVYLNE